MRRLIRPLLAALLLLALVLPAIGQSIGIGVGITMGQRSASALLGSWSFVYTGMDNVGSLDGEATFSRASAGFYLDDTGTLTLAAVDEARITGDGLYLEGVSETNKTTAINWDPSSIDSGQWTLSGNAAIGTTFTQETDATYGGVYRLGGVGAGNCVVLPGASVGNTTPHSWCLLYRGQGSAGIQSSGNDIALPYSADWTSYCFNGATPSATHRKFDVYTINDQEIWFTAFSLVEGAFTTIPVPGLVSGSQSSRAADLWSYTMPAAMQAIWTNEFEVQFTFTPNQGTDVLTTSVPLVSVNGGADLLYVDSTGHICSTDGSVTLTSTSTIVKDTEMIVTLSMTKAGVLSLKINDVEEDSDTSVAGYTDGGTLEMAKGANIPFTVDTLSIYSEVQ